jgi:chemotaxis protein methyltransferase WspC
VVFTDVEKLLSTRLGFDIQSVGPNAIESVVRKCMEEAGYSDPEAYARKLAIDPVEWNLLVDGVVIPETWFFRDIAPFELTANLAGEHFRRSPDQVLRILSYPCSTGEEPYSIVMGILHAGVPPEAFVVDALDVSRHALELARAAAFRARSFRENALWFRTRYFDHAEGTGLWRLKDSVASQVRFHHGNIMSPDFLEDDEPYDIVYCRNLLIYLHTEARLIAMNALRRLLTQNGFLVLGHAEAALAREHGFTAAGPPAAFTFRKTGDRVAPEPRPASRRVPPSTVTGRPPAAALGTVAAAQPPQSNASTESPQERPNALLIVARQFGDAGQLNEALRVCSEYLERVPDSAEGHFLAGVIHDALGHPEMAIDSFRKVLYLDPNHREALLHLALKREASGDGSGAALLRARARRAADLSTHE